MKKSLFGGIDYVKFTARFAYITNALVIFLFNLIIQRSVKRNAKFRM